MTGSTSACSGIDLSVIIPAFNEQLRIGTTLRRVDAFLRSRRYSSEVIVIDDGSNDATADVVRSCQADMRRLSLHRFGENKGKGAAVRAGMIAASGSARLFMDADNSTDISHLDRALHCIEGGADIVIGSRRIDGAAVVVPQPVGRRVAGAGFRAAVRLMFRLRVRDSQNGFKAFTASAADRTFGPLQARGWTFDVEVLARAERLGLRVREIPVEWSNDERSSMSWEHGMGIALDLVSTRLRMPDVDHGGGISCDRSGTGRWSGRETCLTSNPRDDSSHPEQSCSSAARCASTDRGHAVYGRRSPWPSEQ